jgi:hypothetical protein
VSSGSPEPPEGRSGGRGSLKILPTYEIPVNHVPARVISEKEVATASGRKGEFWLPELQNLPILRFSIGIEVTRG